MLVFLFFVLVASVVNHGPVFWNDCQDDFIDDAQFAKEALKDGEIVLAPEYDHRLQGGSLGWEIKPFPLEKVSKNSKDVSVLIKADALWKTHEEMAKSIFESELKKRFEQSYSFDIESKRPDGLSSISFLRIAQQTWPLSYATLTQQHFFVKVKTPTGTHISAEGLSNLHFSLEPRVKELLPPTKNAVVYFTPDAFQHVICVQYTANAEQTTKLLQKRLPGQFKKRVTFMVPVTTLMSTFAYAQYGPDATFEGPKQIQLKGKDRSLGLSSLGYDLSEGAVKKQIALLQRSFGLTESLENNEGYCSESEIYEQNNVDRICVKIFRKHLPFSTPQKDQHLNVDENTTLKYNAILKERELRINAQCFGKYPNGSMAVFRQFFVRKGIKANCATCVKPKVVGFWRVSQCKFGKWTKPTRILQGKEAFELCQQNNKDFLDPKMWF